MIIVVFLQSNSMVVYALQKIDDIYFACVKEKLKMLKKLLRNNCHKFTKELLCYVCLGLNEVLHKFLPRCNFIYKKALFLYYSWKKKHHNSHQVERSVFSYGSMLLKCATMFFLFTEILFCQHYKRPFLHLIPEDMQSIHWGYFALISLLLNEYGVILQVNTARVNLCTKLGRFIS